MNRSWTSMIGRLVGISGAVLLYGCVTVGETPVSDGTLFPEDGTKGRAYLLQQPYELLKHGFRDGKLALVNIIDISSEFGISEIQYGMVVLAHPPGSPIPNPDVAAHFHVGDFKSNLGKMSIDHSGWPHYVRVQNFSDDPTDLLDVFVACEPKPDPQTRFSDVSKMGVSFGNPYTCNLNPNEIYGKLWGSQISEYGELVSGDDTNEQDPVKLQQLRKILERFNAAVIDEVKRQTSQ